MITGTSKREEVVSLHLIGRETALIVTNEPEKYLFLRSSLSINYCNDKTQVHFTGLVITTRHTVLAKLLKLRKKTKTRMPQLRSHRGRLAKETSSRFPVQSQRRAQSVSGALLPQPTRIELNLINELDSYTLTTRSSNLGRLLAKKELQLLIIMF